MKTLRFNGPSAYLVPDPDEDPVARDETFTTTDQRALEHLTSPHYDCSEVGKADPSREELDELARKAGVESPEDLPNKDAVIEATKESEAA